MTQEAGETDDGGSYDKADGCKDDDDGDVIDDGGDGGVCPYVRSLPVGPCWLGGRSRFFGRLAPVGWPVGPGWLAGEIRLVGR